MYDQFIAWLDGTWLSGLFKATTWLVPAVQSIHILAIGVVFSSGVILVLRIAGVHSRHVAIQALSDRLMPWVWWALLVLLVTGSLLIVTEPGRALTNPFFFAKMIFVAIFIVVARVFQLAVRRRPERWSAEAMLPWVARPLSWFALGILLAIIVCGRWIAYYNV